MRLTLPAATTYFMLLKLLPQTAAVVGFTICRLLLWNRLAQLLVCSGPFRGSGGSSLVQCGLRDKARRDGQRGNVHALRWGDGLIRVKAMDEGREEAEA